MYQVPIISFILEINRDHERSCVLNQIRKPSYVTRNIVCLNEPYTECISLTLRCIIGEI